ncbi:MAG: hypothetical protein WCC99_02935 [Candidatus Sulfotelmatobacter sp.]
MKSITLSRQPADLRLLLLRITLRTSILLLLGLVVIVGELACGGNSSAPGGGTTTTTVVSLVTPPPATMNGGAQVSLVAKITGDSTNSGVTWSCTPANTCGSFNPSNAVSTIYTAPLTAGKVTITVTSVAHSAVSASATVTITAIVPTVSFVTPPPPAMFSGASIKLLAQITGDPTNSGITWSCAPAATCGSNPFSSPTTVNTAFAVPTLTTPASVTITATSNADTAASASAAATIVANSNYVFLLSGTNINIDGKPSVYSVSGVVSINKGNVTGGEQDFTGVGVDNFDRIDPDASTLSVTSDGNLQLVLALCPNGAPVPCSGDFDNKVGVNGVETFNGSFLPLNPNKALITEFDTSATSSGTLEWQDPSASANVPSGGYIFGLNGFDGTNNPLSIAGVVNIGASGTISGAGSVFDANEWNGTGGSGTNFQAQPLVGNGSSLVSPPDTLGRVQFTLTPGTGANNATPLPQFSLAGYIVDAINIQLVEIANDALNGTLGGTALSQGSNTGKFDSTFFTGNSYVVGLTGIDTSSSLQFAGLFSASGSAVTGMANYNDLTITGTQSPYAIAGSYAIDGPGSGPLDAGTGRVTITNVNLGPVGSSTLELYLDGSGHALATTLDGTDVLGGIGFQQTSGSFTAASLKGAYVVDATGWHQTTGGLNPLNAAGPVTAPGSGGTFSGTVDLNWLLSSNPGPTFPGLTLSGAFTPLANAVFTGTITGLDVGTATNADSFSLYLIDPTGDGIAIETDTHQLTLLYLAQQ